MKSHRMLEGLLLVSALGIVCVLFLFFTLDLRKTIVTPYTPPPTPNTANTPPRVDTKIIGSEIHIVLLDEQGNITQTLYASSLTDAIADFGVFAVPQVHYEGLLYVRPILDDTRALKIYPLDVATGKIKPSVLSITADAYVLSADQTLLGVQSQNTLAIYALEDGTRIAEGAFNPVPTAIAPALTFTDDACLALVSQEFGINLPQPLCPYATNSTLEPVAQ